MIHSDNQTCHGSQSGQSLVLLALLMVVPVALAALAVDGGTPFFHRRNARIGADAAALGGTHYITNFSTRTETGLLKRVNAIVETYGIAEIDGTPGNNVNDNAAVFIRTIAACV